MQKRLMIIGLCLLLLFFIAGCNTVEDNPNNGDIIDNGADETPDETPEDVTEHEFTEEGIIESEYAQRVIKERADEVINAIKEGDPERLSEYVHPEKGVRFTPYTNVSVNNDIVFTKEQVRNFFDDDETYTWGAYDGTGDQIALTPREYYEKFIYTADFVNTEEVGYNEVLSSGNMMENQFEVYDDPIVVEYYIPGIEEEYEGMDWQSLRLVFEELDGEWYLVGIIHNQWTI